MAQVLPAILGGIWGRIEQNQGGDCAHRKVTLSLFIDLIPDFIPVLGYLDELILFPVGIYFVLKLVPLPKRRGSDRDRGALAPLILTC